MHTTWKIPWREEPGRLQSMGSLESDMTERLHFHFSLSCIGEVIGNPLQCSCLENPRDRGAWWAAVYGVAQSWTRLKRLSSSSMHTTQPLVSQGPSSIHLCICYSSQYRILFIICVQYILILLIINVKNYLLFRLHGSETHLCAVKVKSESLVAQSSPTLCDPMDCSPPGSSVYEIFQARILEWAAIMCSEHL